MQKLIFTLVTFFLFTTVFAQGKAELEKQRLQLKKEIEQTQRDLDETKRTTKENITHLTHINKIIDLQGNVIENISGQLKFIENDIVKSQREVNKLARVLDTLKQEYARSMVYAYKTRSNYDFLNFIFSANNFNDAIKRITYLKSYRNYREMQGDNITRTQTMLQQRIAELSGNKEKKNQVLEEKNKEMTELEKQQAEKEKIVAKLKGRTKELTAEVNNKRKQDAKIRGLIAAMIKREIAIAKKKAEDDRIERDRLAKANKGNSDTKADVAVTKSKIVKKAAGESVLVSSDADRELNADFKRNQHSLPWPVDGVILIHYGNYKIEGTPVIGNNPGVTIGTSVGASVKAVFDGEVTLVNYMEDKQIVFLKHGEYFTVYSNLSSSSVQRGQKVKTGQVIGKAAANDDGQGQVDLILMKDTENVNPEQWLRRK